MRRSPHVSADLGYGLFQFILDPDDLLVLERNSIVAPMDYRYVHIGAGIDYGIVPTYLTAGLRLAYRLGLSVGDDAKRIWGTETSNIGGFLIGLDLRTEAPYIADGVFAMFSFEFFRFSTDFRGQTACSMPDAAGSCPSGDLWEPWPASPDLSENVTGGLQNTVDDNYIRLGLTARLRLQSWGFEFLRRRERRRRGLREHTHRRERDAPGQRVATSRLVLALGVVATMLLLTSCGAKTDLVGADASVVDPFFTFPCRWSFGQRLLVASAPEGFSQVQGAVHPDQDVALVFGAAREAHGAEVTLTDPPRIRTTYSRPRLTAYVGTAGGYAEIFNETRRVPDLRRGRDAVTEQLADLRSADRLHHLPAHSTDAERRERESGTASTSSRSTSTTPRAHSTATRASPCSHGEPSTRSEAACCCETRGGRVRLDHLLPDGTSTFHDLGSSGPLFAVAPDRLLHGAVMLWEDGGAPRIDRVRFDAMGELESVASATQLRRLSARPRPSVVTNETEALLSLLGRQPRRRAAERFERAPGTRSCRRPGNRGLDANPTAPRLEHRRRALHRDRRRRRRGALDVLSDAHVQSLNGRGTVSAGLALRSSTS